MRYWIFAGALLIGCYRAYSVLSPAFTEQAAQVDDY